MKVVIAFLFIIGTIHSNCQIWEQHFFNGNTLFAKGDYEFAENEYDLALSACTQCSDSILSEIYFSKANVYQYAQNPELAFKAIQKSYQQAINYKNSNLLLKVLTKYGEIYRWDNDFESAKVKFELAEEYAISEHVSKEILAYFYQRKAALLAQFAYSKDEIEYYCLKAIETYKALRDTFNICISLNELSSAYRNAKEFDKGLTVSKQAVAIAKTYNNKELIIESTINLCRYTPHVISADSALKYINEALALTDTAIKWLEPIMFLNQIKSIIYFQIGDSLNGFKYRTVQLDRAAKLNDVKSREKVNALKTSYLLQDAKKEKAAIEKSLDELKNKRLFLVVAATILLVFCVLLLRLFIKNYNYVKELKILNKEKDTLVREVHHRVKNNLQSLISLLNLKLDYHSKEFEQNIIHAIINRLETINLSHNLLYNESELEELMLNTFIEKIVELSTQSANKRIKTNVHVVKEKLDIDTCICLGMICNELVTNSIKHAKPEAELSIDISIKLVNDYYWVRYADNGIINENNSSEAIRGLGTEIIQLFMKKLKAKSANESLNGFDCEFYFKK